MFVCLFVSLSVCLFVCVFAILKCPQGANDVFSRAHVRETIIFPSRVIWSRVKSGEVNLPLQNKYHMVAYSFPFLYVVSPPTEPKGSKGDLPPGILKTLYYCLKL